MNSINWPASSVWVFIAQLGEHCSANAEATGSNPVEAPKNFFSGYFRNCLNCDSLRWSHTHFKTIIRSFLHWNVNRTQLAWKNRRNELISCGALLLLKERKNYQATESHTTPNWLSTTTKVELI